MYLNWHFFSGPLNSIVPALKLAVFATQRSQILIRAVFREKVHAPKLAILHKNIGCIQIGTFEN